MRRGITMLEVLVAGLVLSVGLVSAINAIGSCAMATRAADERARATLFARSKLDEILKEPLLQTGSDHGQGLDTSTDYDWQADIAETSNAALYSVTVTVNNRKTGYTTEISCLRRPDLNAPDTTGTDTTGTGSTTTPTTPGTGA